MNSNENNDEKIDKENQEVDSMIERGFRRKRFAMPFIIAAVILVKSAVVMFIWNAMIPDLFHGPVLTYVQALGLSVLAKLLVGFHGFGGRHGGRFGGHGHHGHWRHRMRGYWSTLSEEERAKIREKIKGHCAR